MTEEFLHHTWKFRLFDNNNLSTSSGEPVEIIHAGDHNTDAGPDFFNAKIRIGNTLWAGNIEIHINSSDWKKHQHQHDKAYDNIILHVVYNANEKIRRATSGEIIPAIELKNRFDKKSYEQYVQFKSSKNWIPCEKQLKNIDPFIINSWLDRLLIERLEKKSMSIIKSLKLNKNNWEETFYHHLARNFGFKLNAEPFELLAKSIPLSYLAKHKNNLFQLEAILYGSSGLLDTIFENSYPNQLIEEYQFLEQKFDPKPDKGPFMEVSTIKAI